MITPVFSLLAVIIFTTSIMSCGEAKNLYEEVFVPKEKTMLQFCSDMKSYMQNFSIEDFVQNINNQWALLYPRKAAENSTNQPVTDWEGNMNKFFEDCGIPTEIKTKVIRKKNEKEQEAGVFDIRTLDQNNADFVIKLKYKRVSCVPMRLLLKCMEADSFQSMYPNFKVTVLALSFNSVQNVVILDWIALLYEKGEIIDAQHSSEADCLHSKQFDDLSYKGNRLLNYFERTNE